MFKPIIVLAALLGIQTIQAAETFELSSNMPNLQTVDNTSKSSDWIEEHQKKVDENAWKTFISLMWPANDNTRGEANADAAINDTSNLRVWETWKELYEVYLDNGNKPAAWHEFASLPKSCQTESNDLTTLHLYRTEKADDILDATHQAVKADATLPGTLTDQNSKLVRYDIRLNQTAFDYIIDNQLYNGKIQAQADSITFPSGSMVTKAAWRELTDDDAEKAHQHFVTRSACICDDENKDECHNAKVALVGFHTMKKTQDCTTVVMVYV